MLPWCDVLDLLPEPEMDRSMDLELLGPSDAATIWRTIVEEQAATWTFGHGDDRFRRRPGPPPLRTSPCSSTPAAGGSATATVSCLTRIVEEVGRAQALGSSVEEGTVGGGGRRARSAWARWGWRWSRRRGRRVEVESPARVEAEDGGRSTNSMGSTDSKTGRAVL